MITLLLWLLIFLIIYGYFLYPAFLFLLAKLFLKKIGKGEITPNISIIFSAYNEADVIENKIKNLLELDYPKEKLSIMIGSDGSADRTNDIVRKFSNEQVRLFAFETRRGKAAVLNDLVPQAKGEIIVFTDARQLFAKDALRQLVANFADEKIGCVSGELVFHKSEGATAKGVNLYWNYEKFVRRYESRIHSMLGATGAIYAIRAKLFSPLPTDIILDDMYTPLKIIQQGYRAIFDDSAKAFDQVATTASEEHRRKARTLSGNYQIFGFFGRLFIPFLSPIAIQFISHKLFRVVAPFILITVFLLNSALIYEPTYRTLFILQIIFYTMALFGALLRNTKYAILKPVLNLCYAPYVFCLLNFSALVGFWRFAFVKQNVRWEKARK
ncbi:MAG TPA: glycosyltransferase family 2 protein [Candidatus Omnitrophota bacterium]|nr:glycosyltransferase family 2 protein [Candidatus Omnitrophota bacterium]HPD85190.1 glycosyltransferase family 2 protein [Candidatus Omnitrophota bacterium]HRZ04309.1 glycosyltransferase family 2 protein [Candidatus Omnitrophota bacterium]